MLTPFTGLPCMPDIQAYTPMHRRSQYFPKYTQAQSHRKSRRTHPAWPGTLLLNQKSISGFCPPPHLLPVHTPMCASERSSYHPKGPGVVLSGLPSGRERARAVQPWPQHQDHNLRYSLPALTREQDHALGGSTHAMGEKFDSTKFSPPPPLHPATTPSLPSSTSWLT